MITWLVGPSGAGKTTLGRLLSARLDRPFIDLDERVEIEAGRTIEQIFSSDGEVAFRRLEWNALLDLVDTVEGPCIVALGGGAVVDAGVRGIIRSTGHRLFVDIDAETAIARLEGGPARPLLYEEDPIAAWRQLYGRRHNYYRDCDAMIRSDADPELVAARAEEALAQLDEPMWSIDSTIGGERSVVEGYRSLHALLTRLEQIIGDRRSIIVTDAMLASEYGELLTGGRYRLGTLFSIDAGEREKTLASAEQVIRNCATSGLTRDDVLVGFGGGVVTDLVGFAASVYMRGIECVYVPTTLLAQVDAAIGGKTALDVAGIRNLVGTVRQPRHVLMSPSLLRSLPPRELRSGFVESVKMGIANSAGLAAECDRASAAIIAGEIPENIDAVIELSIRTKLAVVERDAHDTSERLSLNFGHTFGHALEAVEHDRHAHGEAVAFGIVCAAEAAGELGSISEERRDEILSRVVPFAGPVGREHDVEAIVAAMFTDKKRTGTGLRLILPLEQTGVRIHETTDRDLLRRAVTRAIERLD
jgi:shikimate kinase / 3-dehydroquinate synthase